MDTIFKDAPGDPVSSPSESQSATKHAADPSTEALVKEWLTRIQRAKKKWKPVFDQMSKDEQLAAEGADEAWIKADHYVAPITPRHINQAVAKLYAKNPKAQASRRKKLMFKLWDGRQQTLAAALQAMQPPQTVVPNPDPGLPPIDMATGQPWTPDPNAVALLEEIGAAQQYERMVDQLGKGVELLWDYYTSEGQFKTHMKAAVRRTKVCRVSYVKLAFQRSLVPSPEAMKLNDATTQLAKLGTLAKGENLDDNEARTAELQTLIAQLQDQPQEITGREGPIFDFPRANKIIVDEDCTHLKTFTGARYIAHEIDMKVSKVNMTYDVDLKKGDFTDFSGDSTTDDKKIRAKTKDVRDPIARVYEVQDKENGQAFTVCEGYCDFLKSPAEPDVRVERFWTIFSLVFNEVEGEGRLYPPSDVYLTRHSAAEYNRTREGNREHRVANRPKYASSMGALSAKDKDKLASNISHMLLELKGLKPGQPVAELIQRIQPIGIDPNMYDVSMYFEDITRTIGTQEADIGGTSDASATQSSIAENSRGASLSENVDDLDSMLSELAHAFCQLCLRELSKETVIEIVGPGAVWPEMQPTREEIAKDLMLEIKAGSSGRPNVAAELANCERVLPYAIQIPNAAKRVEAIFDRILGLLDIDVEEMDANSVMVPSVTAQNAIDAKNGAVAPGTGDPMTDPAQQGGQGVQNAPSSQRNEPGAQPAQPAPAPSQGGPLQQA